MPFAARIFRSDRHLAIPRAVKGLKEWFGRHSDQMVLQTGHVNDPTILVNQNMAMLDQRLKNINQSCPSHTTNFNTAQLMHYKARLH